MLYILINVQSFKIHNIDYYEDKISTPIDSA